MRKQIETIFKEGNSDILVKTFADIDDVTVSDFISELIRQNHLSIKDILDNCGYNNESLLYDMPDYIIEDYYNDNLKEEDNDGITGYSDFTEKDILKIISAYCHNKHTLVDYNTVIEDIKDLLERNNFDKRMLPLIF